MAITVGAGVCVQPPLQGNGKHGFQHSNPGKRWNFWESVWGRVGLGPGDGMRVLSGITQQPQPLSGYCLLAQMGSPGEAVSLAELLSSQDQALLCLSHPAARLQPLLKAPEALSSFCCVLSEHEVASLPQPGFLSARTALGC